MEIHRTQTEPYMTYLSEKAYGVPSGENVLVIGG